MKFTVDKANRFVYMEYEGVHITIPEETIIKLYECLTSPEKACESKFKPRKVEVLDSSP